jgi:beta-mannosidase
MTGLRSKKAESSWLIFDGLDTFATVKLCSQVVGTANNQFRQWKYDVSDILKSCKSDPVISIDFGSAPAIANSINAQPGQESK